MNENTVKTPEQILADKIPNYKDCFVPFKVMLAPTFKDNVSMLIIEAMKEYAAQFKDPVSETTGQVEGSWISVENDVPDEKSVGRVLCWCEEINDLGKSAFFWNCSYSKLHGFTDNGKSYHVTHWKEVTPPDQSLPAHKVDAYVKPDFCEFNLNNYILVEITDYGWAELKKTKDAGFIEHCIKAKKEVVDGVDYYKLQAHFVIETFGDMLWMSFPAPLMSKILIPTEHIEWLSQQPVSTEQSMGIIPELECAAYDYSIERINKMNCPITAQSDVQSAYIAGALKFNHSVSTPAPQEVPPAPANEGVDIKNISQMGEQC